MGPLLIDLSAWARKGQAAVTPRWLELLKAGRLFCHPLLALECLHGATTPKSYQQLLTDLEDGLVWIHPDTETTQIALRLQKRMATNSPCGQRVKSVDLLTAALAIQNDVGVLHYDADYDLIRSAGDQRLVSEWVVPRGSLDSAASQTRAVRADWRKALGERLVQLEDNQDLVVWPKLIDWMDDELTRRGLPVPRRPDH